ncbi:AAA domain-containing protein [Mycena metata]|uniref:AAA domain-containing protein n=1 Tax=Mycena metata TaxID=1033252 RepID=A0AAD7NU27_9AGAR|nr:AAA domain-containing protein [Mycena metata]
MRPGAAQWEHTLWKKLEVGDIVLLREDEQICTTCITSASTALNVVDFPVVFLDEASMSTEPASLIPIIKGLSVFIVMNITLNRCSRHPLRSLGTTSSITSPEAQVLGLRRSLFERLTEEGVVPSIMLDIQLPHAPQYLLFPLPQILQFLASQWDSGRGLALPCLTSPTSAHLKEDKKGNRPAVNLMGKYIGIIAPHVAQISLLTRLFNTDAKARERFNTTADGFKGREKEIIVFSTVRNNAGGYIGLLADRRRLNLGLTRAKRGLFVLGSIRVGRKYCPTSIGKNERCGARQTCTCCLRSFPMRNSPAAARAHEANRRKYGLDLARNNLGIYVRIPAFFSLPSPIRVLPPPAPSLSPRPVRTYFVCA